MRELALHILDVAENSIRAGASLVEIDIEEKVKDDRLSISIRDNGSGFDVSQKQEDEYFTCKEGKRYGLGIPLFRQAAERCEGSLSVISAPGEGTVVEAAFRLGHIDLMPMGDMGSTIAALVSGGPDADFVLRYMWQDSQYVFDTRSLRDEIEGLPLNTPQVLRYIKEKVNEGTRRHNGRH